MLVRIALVARFAFARAARSSRIRVFRCARDTPREWLAQQETAERGAPIF